MIKVTDEMVEAFMAAVERNCGRRLMPFTVSEVLPAVLAIVEHDRAARRKRPDVTRYRLTVRGTAGETLEIGTGEVSTAAGKITLPLTFRNTASIEIEWHAEDVP